MDRQTIWIKVTTKSIRLTSKDLKPAFNFRHSISLQIFLQSFFGFNNETNNSLPKKTMWMYLYEDENIQTSRLHQHIHVHHKTTSEEETPDQQTHFYRRHSWSKTSSDRTLDRLFSDINDRFITSQHHHLRLFIKRSLKSLTCTKKIVRLVNSTTHSNSSTSPSLRTSFNFLSQNLRKSECYSSEPVYS